MATVKVAIWKDQPAGGLLFMKKADELTLEEELYAIPAALYTRYVWCQQDLKAIQKELKEITSQS